LEDYSKILVMVTGATGYVGGRLVPRLLAKGYRVRCLVRDPSRLEGHPWKAAVEVAAGDVLQAETLPPAMKGVRIAYYLVHSLVGGADFHQRDLAGALNFAFAAKSAGIERIIFLGGLADASSSLSEHLRSRHQTGFTLRSAGVPVTEFRAGIIVGSGSISFEIVRYLTERVPILICPRWVYTRTQPIGIREVLEYLVAAIETPESAGRIIEIGGADIVTYGQMMLIYAQARGLRRLMLPVPFLTPRLSSHWVSLIAGSRRRRPPADRRPAQRERGAGSDSPTAFSPNPAGGLPDGGGARPGPSAGEPHRNDLEGCAEHQSGRCAAGHSDHPGGDDRGASQPCCSRSSRGRFPGVYRFGRETGLVLHELGVASSWFRRSADRRGGAAARQA